MISMESATGHGFPLSFQQRCLCSEGNDWRRLANQIVVRIEGPHNPRLLKAAIGRIVAKNKIFRTNFEQVDGIRGPLQFVRSDPAFSWTELTSKGNGTSAEELRKKAVIEFDLNVGQPLQAIYAPIDEDAGLLVLSLSALCSDQGTLNNLIKDIAIEYSGGTEQNGSEALQYLQFSAWHQSLLDDEEAETDRAYWQATVTEVENNQLLFPFEGNNLPSAGHTIGVYQATMSGVNAGAIDALASEHDITPEILLFTCWNILLWRLSDQPVQSTWITFPCRDHEMLRSLYGPLAITVPIRVVLDPSMTLRQAFSKTSDLVSVAAERAFTFRTETSQHPSLRSLRIGFEFGESVGAHSTGLLQFTKINCVCCPNDMDLKLVITSEPDSLEARIYFNVHRFSSADVRQMLSAMETLLGCLRRIELLSDSVFDLDIPPARTSTDDSIAKAETIPERFAKQAAVTPDRLAVLSNGQRLTFAELDRKANQVANYLIQADVSAEDYVAICMERSSSMLIALLGILKASAAYLPLDPAYPPERLNTLLAEANCKFILTQQSLIDQFRGKDIIPVSVDTDAGIQVSSEDAPQLVCSPENVAYLIYTSGSTGVPKGVMVQHGSVIDLLDALDEGLGLRNSGTMRIALNAPLVFDASVKQWIQILRGRTLLILSEEDRIDPSQFSRILRDNDVDLVDATPSHFKLLMDENLSGDGKNPPTVLLGGEAIDEQMWRALQQTPRGSFYNLYGPTECTVDVSICRVGDADHPSIGRPLAGRKMYVLDHHLRPVPTLFPGELYVGGACVARGYFKRPDLTAERFVPDPFSGDTRARLYRTGDRVCRLTDGTFRYIGRIDDQVKIRGHRIEPGEIAAVLRDAEGIRDACVLVRGEEQHLIACVAREAGASPTAETLRQHARQKLPAYMVPSTFAILDRLPLTANGKIDKSALLKSDYASTSRAEDTPRSEMEAVLAEMWREILQLTNFGIHDNFFDIGGNSLLMVRLHNRIRDVLKRELSMVDLFRNPTIALLSEHIRAGAPIIRTSTGQDRAAKRLAAAGRLKR